MNQPLANATVKTLVSRNLSPVQDRVSFLNMRMDQGASYAQAIREWDSRKDAEKLCCSCSYRLRRVGRECVKCYSES